MKVASRVKKKKKMWCIDVIGRHAVILRELQHSHEQDFRMFKKERKQFFTFLTRVEPHIIIKTHEKW